MGSRPRFPIGRFKVAATDEIAPGALLDRTFVGEQVVGAGTPGVGCARLAHVGRSVDLNAEHTFN
jgi:hypothetical protein